LEGEGDKKERKSMREVEKGNRFDKVRRNREGAWKIGTVHNTNWGRKTQQKENDIMQF